GGTVPRSRRLQTCEQVEIIPGKHSGPSRDWLNSNLGYVTTPRARAKIVHRYKLQARQLAFYQSLAGSDVLVPRLQLEPVD
ncbi:GTP diphosphokinase, partial [Pseudomonas aeruginosa]